MYREDGNCQSQEVPAQFEQVVGSFLTWFAYEELTMSVTWQISPGVSGYKGREAYTQLTPLDRAVLNLLTSHQFIYNTIHA
jgi:hypothetical protein